MQISIPRELYPGETRVPMIPSVAGSLVKLGAEVVVESGIGLSCGYTDDEYVKAGAELASDRKKMLQAADMVLRLRKPEVPEIELLKKGAVHVSYLDPYKEKELVRAFMDRGVSAVSMEMIPRTTRAQKMDALSSQASLAGYVSVILAAERLAKSFPMMMTPAGTIAPARVFIVGAGVAGLQAIATAKRLGARVDAFDVRPVVEEQVKSLGAKFLKIDLGDTGQTTGGYAKQLTKEQLDMQRAGMAKHCAQMDVVITTAQVFGKKAPVLISTAMVKGMMPSSVVIDMAVEGGGNVECSVAGQEIDIDGVLVVGLENLPGRVAYHASQMYANNLAAFVEEFWDKEEKLFKLNTDDEIIKGCLVTHGGAVCNEGLG